MLQKAKKEQEAMDEKSALLIKSWQKRNIAGLYCENKDFAAKQLLELIPADASVGFSGSKTLGELDIIRSLESRGTKVFNQNKPGLSPQENLKLRKQGVQADFYLASPNAIAESGELVFFSAYGNRTAGIAFADRVIFVAGINKIAKNLQEAMQRARDYVTPLNCKRLNWNTPCVKDGICRETLCVFPEYQRMCCQVLIIEAEKTAGRIQVVLVGESLGF